MIIANVILGNFCKIFEDNYLELFAVFEGGETCCRRRTSSDRGREDGGWRSEVEHLPLLRQVRGCRLDHQLPPPLPGVNVIKFFTAVITHVHNKLESLERLSLVKL
jgi:hypothetical protein